MNECPRQVKPIHSIRQIAPEHYLTPEYSLAQAEAAEYSLAPEYSVAEAAEYSLVPEYSLAKAEAPEYSLAKAEDPSTYMQSPSWERLPIDILNIVLEYNGYYKLRNGKHMRQLEKKRMNAIRTIPTITMYLPNLTHVNLDSRYEVNYIKTIEGKTYKNTIRTIVLEDHVVWVMTSYALSPLNYMYRGRMGLGEQQVKTERFVVYE